MLKGCYVLLIKEDGDEGWGRLGAYSYLHDQMELSKSKSIAMTRALHDRLGWESMRYFRNPVFTIVEYNLDGKLLGTPTLRYSMPTSAEVLSHRYQATRGKHFVFSPAYK